jgi:hypothetical protein
MQLAQCNALRFVYVRACAGAEMFLSRFTYLADARYSLCKIYSALDIYQELAYSGPRTEPSLLASQLLWNHPDYLDPAAQNLKS